MRLLLLCIIAVVFLAGCNVPTYNVLRYDSADREPKPETYQVDILDRDSIGRGFQVIAEVTDDVSNIYESAEGVLNNFRVATRRIGGDALIDLESQAIDDSYDWIPSEKTVYKAKIIVFTE